MFCKYLICYSIPKKYKYNKVYNVIKKQKNKSCWYNI